MWHVVTGLCWSEGFQGHGPWRNTQNYLQDKDLLHRSQVNARCVHSSVENCHWRVVKSEDKKNHIVVYITIGETKKKPKDYFEGQMLIKGKIVS